jgi:hypothetical protein
MTKTSERGTAMSLTNKEERELFELLKVELSEILSESYDESLDVMMQNLKQIKDFQLYVKQYSELSKKFIKK